jgi:hypothetical protein
MAWDIRTRSTDYLARAESARTRVNKYLTSIHHSDQFKRLHDQALAEFHVFNRLHGRNFLKTPVALLAELQTMKGEGHKIHDPRIIDRPTFEGARLTEIDFLMRRLKVHVPHHKDTVPPPG